ncbi:MAG TPA: hypothetical protein VHT21_01070 [Stellaceae bacterium]|nr:hypothetical protein [Stellaceae bacterium]
MATIKTTEKPPTKPRRKASEKAQFERFVETARQIGVDEDPEALDRAFGKIIPKPTKPHP